MKTGYKQTEIGVIPEDWEVELLGDLTTAIGDGIHSTPKYVNQSEFYFVNGNNLVDDEIKITATTQCVSEVEYKNLKKPLSDRTILFSINGTIGNLAFYDGEQVVLGKSAAYLNIAKDTSKEFIAYSLKSRAISLFFENELTGSTIKNLSLQTLRNCPIPLPQTQQEQTAIAAALSDVDALMGELDKLIAKKRDIKQATMQQLLTGKKRLAGFSGEWEVVSMAKHATLKARIGWQALTTEEYLDSGTHYLVTGTDFIDGQVNWSSCHFVDEWRYNQDKNIQLRDGDVLLTKDGTIGKVGYVENIDAPATLNSGVFVIRPIGAAFTPLFLFYILTSRIFDEFLAKITAGSTIVHLYQKDFITFDFFAPSIEEQTTIATILSDMDAEINALQQKRDKTAQLKQGMMQELLTGRIRLVSNENLLNHT
jgi:type I restriction enzyme S subunit